MESSAIGIGHYENICAFACQSIFQATHGAASSAVVRANPVFLGLQTTQAAIALVPPAITVWVPAMDDEGLLSWCIAAVSILWLEGEAIVGVRFCLDVSMGWKMLGRPVFGLTILFCIWLTGVEESHVGKAYMEIQSMRKISG